MSFPARDFRRYLAQVPDPRGRKGTRHPLSAILTAVICAVLSGANGYKPIAQWLHTQTVDVWHFLEFTRTPIKYGALRNLLMEISPEAFEAALSEWLREIHRGDPLPELLEGLSIDGKVLRGTLALDQRALMLISAYDHTTASVLRQQAVPADTNEQKAALDLLKKLVLSSTSTSRPHSSTINHPRPSHCPFSEPIPPCFIYLPRVLDHSSMVGWQPRSSSS